MTEAPTVRTGRTGTPHLPGNANSSGPPTMRFASTGTLIYGLTVGEVLQASTLADARLLAGASGLGRIVQRLNVMEVPDILPWVKPHELLLTTGYPLRNTPQSLPGLAGDLEARGLAALAIKVGRYLDGLPAELLTEADRLGFPIIQLPHDVAFDDILNQVLTDILNRQASLIARSDEVHRALVQIVLGGGGISELAAEVAAQLGAAVVVSSSGGIVRASAGPDAQVPSQLPAGGPQAATVDGRAIGVGARCAVVDVIAGGANHGSIAAYSESHSFEVSDVTILERAATVAALVMTREAAVAAVESKYRADFLRDALDGRGGDRSQIIGHAASLGWALDRPVVVVVGELDPHAPAPAGPEERAVQEKFTAAWERAVRQQDPSAAIAGFSHQVVAVIGTDRGDPLALARDWNAAVSSAPAGLRRPFSIGLSRVAADPIALPDAYGQAMKAMRVGRQMAGPGAVTRFDDLGVFRLLSLVPDSGELRSFLDETLGPLADLSDPAAADLRHTLEVLLDSNLNVAETARRLHFHYNSLRYRIGRLERAIGPFTTDATLRLNVVLALQVLRMRGL
jgi:PucR family transcriptional regulator, purine catabolism regulatory protein